MRSCLNLHNLIDPARTTSMPPSYKSLSRRTTQSGLLRYQNQTLYWRNHLTALIYRSLPSSLIHLFELHLNQGNIIQYWYIPWLTYGCYVVLYFCGIYSGVPDEKSLPISCIYIYIYMSINNIPGGQTHVMCTVRWSLGRRPSPLLRHAVVQYSANTVYKAPTGPATSLCLCNHLHYRWPVILSEKLSVKNSLSVTRNTTC